MLCVIKKYIARSHSLIAYLCFFTNPIQNKEVTLLNPNYDKYDQVYNHKSLEKLVCFIKFYDCSTKPLPSYLVNATGINLLLTEREGSAGEYWPEVVAVRTERSEIRTKTTEGQYSPVRLELARLVSSLLYGTRTMLVLNLAAFENKKYTADDRFHGQYGQYETVSMAESLPRKNQSKRSDLPCHIIKPVIWQQLILLDYKY